MFVVWIIRKVTRLTTKYEEIGRGLNMTLNFSMHLLFSFWLYKFGAVYYRWAVCSPEGIYKKTITSTTSGCIWFQELFEGCLVWCARNYGPFHVPPPHHEALRSLSPLNVTEPGDETCLQVCSWTSLHYVLNVKAIYRPHLSCSKQARKYFRLQPL